MNPPVECTHGHQEQAPPPVVTPLVLAGSKNRRGSDYTPETKLFRSPFYEPRGMQRVSACLVIESCDKHR